MALFDKIFRKKLQPEDYFVVTITDELVKVEHPQRRTESVKWKDVHAILLINTDEGPLFPDVWLTLADDNGRCRIPQGAKGFEELYEIVSKFDGFNFENFIKSMSTTDNAEFLLWTKTK